MVYIIFIDFHLFGTYQLVQSNILSNGNRFYVGGYTLNSAIGQFIANEISPQSTTVISGYLSQIYSDSLLLFVTGIDSTKTMFSNNILWGVKENASLIINFSNDISTSVSDNDLQLFYMMDHLGNLVNSTYTFTIERGDHSLKLFPQNTWSYGGSFSIYVSTKVKDINGLTLSNPTTFYFSVIMDSSTLNIIKLIGDDGSYKSYLSISSNSLNGKYFVIVSTQVNIETISPSDCKKQLKLLSMDTRDSNANKVLSNYSYEIYFLYNDSNNDGIIDGTEPISVKDLLIWRFDLNRNIWIREKPKIDYFNKRVWIKENVPLTYYLFGVKVANDVSSSHCYPVPFRPNIGNTKYGSWTDGIRFTNLPSYGKIRIYTITGEIVREIDIDENEEVWDVRNSNGEIVSSGVYIWEVESDGNRKAGKLMIIR